MEAFRINGVGTVGQLLVHPNSCNVIPGRVDFSMDLRHPEDGPLKAMAEAVRAALDRMGELGLTGTLQEIWYAPPTPFHPDCLAQVCPSAMIFIPCKDGISHNEIEDATPEDVAAGCDVLLQAILEKATE